MTKPPGTASQNPLHFEQKSLFQKCCRGAETPRLRALSGAESERRRDLAQIGFIRRLMRPERRPGANFARSEPLRLASGCDGGGHRLNAEDVERAASALDEKTPEAMRRCAQAKQVATDAGFAAANDALQLLGGYGYLADYGVEKLVRDLRVHQISGGDE